MQHDPIDHNPPPSPTPLHPTHHGADLPTNLPTDRRALLAGIGGLAAGALLAGSRTAHAGPINPPAGPVAGTGKTTQEIFDRVAAVESRIAINATNTPGDADSLFKITQPGSYYLTGNITGVVGKHGIEIVASGVTIDLNGFDLVGVPGSLDGVRAPFAELRSITVLNGYVRSWGVKGIDFLFVINSRLEGVSAIGNTSFGISTGTATLTNCTASDNIGAGIHTGGRSVVTECTASNNVGSGISTAAGSTVRNCVAAENDNGISAGSGSTVINCASSSNSSVGIGAGAGSTVTTCTALSNGRNGISTSGSTIIGCASSNNGIHGIQIGNACLVRNNMCEDNGTTGIGAGIQSSGNRNCIEDNSCSNNRIGIECTASSSFFARNTCSGNALNWDIAANNICLVVNATLSGAISGNSGGVSPGSTNPNANYTY